MTSPTTRNGARPRAALAGLLVTSLLTAFALLGGGGLASAALNALQYQYGKKVVVCHKGKTIVVGQKALKAHQKHGDTIGRCAQAHKGKGKARGKAKQIDRSSAPATQPAQTTETARPKPAKPKHQDTSRGGGKGRGK